MDGGDKEDVVRLWNNKKSGGETRNQSPCKQKDAPPARGTRPTPHHARPAQQAKS